MENLDLERRLTFDYKTTTELSEWSDAQWKEFVQEASRDELGSILVKARRITIFHRTFQRTRPSRWNNQTWEIVCKQVIGIERTTCAQYETIYRMFYRLIEVDLSESVQIEQDKLRNGLPTTMYSLYLIAQAYEIDPDMVMTFIEVGACTAGLPQKNAKIMLETIRKKKDGTLDRISAMEAEREARSEILEGESDTEDNEVAEDDKPLADQITRRDRRPKFEARMEEAILRSLYRYRTETKMLDEALTYFVHQWIEHLSLIDLLQDFRKKYGDADMISALKWLLETIEDSGKSGADNLWNRGAAGGEEKNEEP
jgi:hypothetical protein